MTFRRRPLHERLAREAGLLDPPGEDRRAPWDKAGIHGVHRPREWDDIATLAAELEGERAEFVVLDDEVIVEYGPRGIETFADRTLGYDAARVLFDAMKRASARRGNCERMGRSSSVR